MKILSLAAAVAVFAFPAFAETYNMTGTVTAVNPNYRNVNVPVTVQDCRNVEVPVYGTAQGSATGGDVLMGMIVGGLLGKGISGNDNGAAAGAVMGGVIAADKGGKRQVVTGYRTERQCSNQTVYETRRELTDYTVSYEILGVTQRANVSRKYRVGDSIPVQVHIGLR